MSYAVCVRIDVNQFVPVNLRQGRLFVHKSGHSKSKLEIGQIIQIPEVCEFAEVLSMAPAGRAPTEYNFILG